jgi:hypothetical protein
MKKIAAIVSSIAFLLLPASSFAAVVSINGFNDSAHTLATTTGASTMHLKIVSTGGSGTATHTFQWDNSPWSIAQGGTGTTTFATGSLLFYGGSTITEDNSNLFWDASSKFLGIGTKTPTQKLEVVGNIKLSGTIYAGTAVAIGTTTARHALDVAGAMYSELVTTSSSVDWNAGNVQTITLSSSPTLTFSNGQAGGKYDLIRLPDLYDEMSRISPESF